MPLEAPCLWMELLFKGLFWEAVSSQLSEESQPELCLPQTLKLYSGQSQSYTDDSTEKDSGRRDLLILQ